MRKEIARSQRGVRIEIGPPSGDATDLQFCRNRCKCVPIKIAGTQVEILLAGG